MAAAPPSHRLTRALGIVGVLIIIGSFLTMALGIMPWFAFLLIAAVLWFGYVPLVKRMAGKP
ncbi:hypothetical protein JXB02_05475 [Candidatus Woesearchaeota archaeon]|nr:hypothetical protein [Candidatus Woesearchaeota archaeon]